MRIDLHTHSSVSDGTESPTDLLATAQAAGLDVVALGWYGLRVSEWWMRTFIVSTRRVLLTSGVIARTVTLLPLRRITDLTWKETVPGQRPAVQQRLGRRRLGRRRGGQLRPAVGTTAGSGHSAAGHPTHPRAAPGGVSPATPTGPAGCRPAP